METVRLSYRELAERLRVKPESARKMAQRRRWKRDVANDGTARVHVPVEALPGPGDVAPEVTLDVALGVTPSPAEPSLAVSRELELRIESLRALLLAEGRRADAAEADRDRWHALAVRPWWRRLAG